ncbi:hypothetical protein SDC9_184879 [bioreactor metagenome]|uniref:Uncharacterized protein n=1 Tax=bioreactor metagenome TaxID=1076179 RepID=A0A645HG54_9ZZZZ
MRHRERIARRQNEPHFVAARGQPGKQILPVSSCRGALEVVAAAIVELHRHTGEAGFAIVLLAILVGIKPHTITQAAFEVLVIGADLCLRRGGELGAVVGRGCNSHVHHALATVNWGEALQPGLGRRVMLVGDLHRAESG